MKKILFSLVAVAAAFSANAQIKNDRGTFDKPVAGNLAIELQVSPNVVGGGSFNLNDPFLQILASGLNTGAITGNTGSSQSFADLTAVSPMLKGRYFLSDNLALRVQLGILSASSTAKDEPVPGTSTKDKIGQSGFAVAIGLEKHYSGAERLSTYVGGDLLIGTASARSSFDNGTDEFKSAQGGFGFGLRGVTGFDYYFIPKVYIGAELGLGLSYNSYGVVKASGGALEDAKAKSSEFALTPFVLPAFRLGFRF